MHPPEPDYLTTRFILGVFAAFALLALVGFVTASVLAIGVVRGLYWILGF